MYNAYLEILKNLGVKASFSKTFVSKRFLEFAKRFHYRGRDVTPFPTGAFLDSFRDKSLIGNALDNALAKGWMTVPLKTGTGILPGIVS